MTTDRTLWILTSVLIGFTLLSIFNGSEWVKFQNSNLHKIKVHQKQRLEKHKKDIVEYSGKHELIGSEAPNSAFSIGTYTMLYIVKPPYPNATFAVGQSDLYPYYIRFSSIDRSNMLLNEEVLNPVNLLIGKLDFSFFTIYLIPLLIIVMTYDFFASERELRTFILLRIYYPNILKFLLIKWFFRVGWFFMVFYLGIFIALVLFSPFPLNYYDWSTLLLIGISSVYALFWFALCFIINMLNKNSLFNGIALTMLWLFIVLLLPAVLNIWIERKYPIPSRNTEIVKQREIKENTDNQGVFRQYLKAHPEYHAFKSDTIGKNVIAGWYPSYIVSVAVIDSLNDMSEQKFKNSLTMQETKLQDFSLISPALITNLAFNQISGNSYIDFKIFKESFKEQQSQWRAFVYDHILKGIPFKATDLNRQSNFIVYKGHPFPIDDNLRNLLWILILSIILILAGILQFKKNKYEK
ncbi:MAG: ABC transporter permease [Chryseobacterium sp.]|nr:ABC transporter permease [Chryseobacterium sp.]